MSDERKIPSHEHTNEGPLSQSEIESSIDPLSSREISIVAGARVDTTLLDLEEDPAKAGESFAERKSEIEAALEIINTTKSDDEKGLSPSGVIAKRIETIKDAAKNEEAMPKLWESRLAALELARGVLSEVFWEGANKLAKITRPKEGRPEISDELYQEHQDVINSDIRDDHNSRIRENDKRRKLLEQRKHVAGISTRS